MNFAQMYFIVGGPLLVLIIALVLTHFTKPKHHAQPGE